MHYEQMTITPELAARWLKEKNNRNRILAKATVDAYANDMANGRWKQTHQNAIAFYANGNLADGQHRLAAIVQSGVSIDFLVVFGLADDDAYGIDAHRMRGTHDQIKIAGGNDWITKDIVAISRMMMSGKKQSPQEIVEFSNQNKEALQFALEHMPKSHFSAPVRVAIAYAYEFEQKSELINWCQIARTGIGSDHRDRSVIAFRERMNKDLGLIRGGGGAVVRELTCKLAMKSIYAYCRGQALTRLVEPKDRIYVRS
jgi:hypothetical protein